MSEITASTCTEDFAPMRKGIFVELFLMYLVYLVISIGLYFKNPDQDVVNTGQNNDGVAPPNQAQNNKSQVTSIEQLNRFFTIFFGYHIIPIGMSLIYQARIYSIVLAYLHFFAFILILVGHYKEKVQIKNFAYAFSGLFNIMLICGAIVGLASHELGCL